MIPEFSIRLAKWHQVSGRHNLPWQGQGPYSTWISEIMLQQTQVQVVIPYYESFLVEFPNPTVLANSCLDQVLALWAGLGYYARARNLHEAAKQIREDHAGIVPDNLDDLMRLKGIGRSTAGAILSLGFKKSGVIQDGNVRRVLARLFLIDDDLSTSNSQRLLWNIAHQLAPNAGHDAAIHTQAMMDFGALLCTKHKPGCEKCLFRKECLANQSKRVSEIPTPKRAKRKELKQWIMLEVRNEENRILLIKRPEKGIWGGLYAPPIGESLLTLGATIGIEEVLEASELTTLEHSFSHFSIQLLHFRLCAEPKTIPAGAFWAEIDTFQGGLPAPVKKLLKNEEKYS